MCVWGQDGKTGSEYVFLRAPRLILSDSPIKTFFQSQNKNVCGIAFSNEHFLFLNPKSIPKLILDGFAKSPQSGHCEHSEAISCYITIDNKG